MTRSLYPDVKGSYYCWECGRSHWKHSLIGQAHGERETLERRLRETGLSTTSMMRLADLRAGKT